MVKIMYIYKHKSSILKSMQIIFLLLIRNILHIREIAPNLGEAKSESHILVRKLFPQRIPNFIMLFLPFNIRNNLK